MELCTYPSEWLHDDTSKAGSQTFFHMPTIMKVTSGFHGAISNKVTSSDLNICKCTISKRIKQ